jgi:hypothetical protein
MQDRKTYANGNTLTTEGFRCSIGEPIDIKVTVGEDEEVVLPVAAGKIIQNGDHLITLEVNGEKVAYRDLYHLGEDTVTVGDYTISDDMFLTGVSEDDEVFMRLEPVEVIVTDAFRAAVAKTAPKASGGGGGSGGDDTEYVTFTMDDALGEYVCDHSYERIKDAMLANKKVVGLVVYQDQEAGNVMKSYLPSIFDGSIEEGGGSSYFAIIFFGVGVSSDHGSPAMSTVQALVTMQGVVGVRFNAI